MPGERDAQKLGYPGNGMPEEQDARRLGCPGNKMPGDDTSTGALAPDQPQLQGGREHGRDRALHGPAAAARGGGGSAGAAAVPRPRPLPLDQARQPLPGGRHQEERQRLPGLRLPLQGLLRVLQGAGGGERPGQLRHRLRAAGRAHGLRLPADHRQQDPAGVHHPGGQQAGHGQVTRARHRHQRCVLALRRHQVQEERGLHRRRRVREPAGERQRRRAAQRGGGHHQAEGLPLGDARAAPGLERPRPLRADRTGQEQVGGAGGRQVPPVREALALRQRPHHLLRAARRRLRAHVLPPQHPGEAAHLDRVGHREVLPQPGGDPGEGQGAVQEAVGGQRGGDRRAGAQRRRLAQVQDQRGLRQVPPGEERGHLDHQVLPGREGAPDARPLRAAQRGEGGGRGAAAHLRPLRDPLLHRLGNPGALHEDRGEERLPGAALGALHHPQRRLPAPHHLEGPRRPTGIPGAPRTSPAPHGAPRTSPAPRCPPPAIKLAPTSSRPRGSLGVGGDGPGLGDTMGRATRCPALGSCCPTTASSPPGVPLGPTPSPPVPVAPIVHVPHHPRPPSSMSPTICVTHHPCPIIYIPSSVSYHPCHPSSVSPIIHVPSSVSCHPCHPSSVSPIIHVPSSVSHYLHPIMCVLSSMSPIFCVPHHPCPIIRVPSSTSHHVCPVIHVTHLLCPPSSMSHHPCPIIYIPSSTSHHPRLPSSVSPIVCHPSSVSHHPCPIIHVTNHPCHLCLSPIIRVPSSMSPVVHVPRPHGGTWCPFLQRSLSPTVSPCPQVVALCSLLSLSWRPGPTAV
ncbi:AP-1 complex subunit mu-2 isoform X1 [Rhea pennata]|uniref:AP-1 complex subunit mu-2 isoform X1 n=1 Tax=Rhea pennata TaxID=8795 RepID=UPI002E26C907